MGKSLLGGLLLAIPILQFFAFGYFGRVIAEAKRHDSFEMPEWKHPGPLFVSGLAYFLLLLGLGGGLFLLAFISSLPFRGWAGPLAFIPYIPAMLLSPPLVAAGWYRYNCSGELVDGFRLTELFRLLQETGFPLLLPTLAFIGFLAATFPLFPLAFFVGGIVVLFYYSLLFRRTETDDLRRIDLPFSVL
ncbi:MAG TPA: DUF4013 domain-containing protein [Opitutales bacterium]|nr:DUF4013 domain-containing protein [Opitutales bacterium]